VLDLIVAKAPEKIVRALLAERLNLRFEDKRQPVDQWGHADGLAILPNGVSLVLEVEAKQKHPTTNVLKYWPYLENHEDRRIVLGHCFFPDSPGLASSRGKLALWLGERLEQIFEGRFFYQRLVVSTAGEPDEGFSELEQRLQLL
jgi:hypothetical protein